MKSECRNLLWSIWNESTSNLTLLWKTPFTRFLPNPLVVPSKMKDVSDTDHGRRTKRDVKGSERRRVCFGIKTEKLSETYLVLLQSTKLLDKSVVRVFAANDRRLECEEVLDGEAESDEGCNSHTETTHSGVRIDDWDIRTPHRKNFFLLVDLRAGGSVQVLLSLMGRTHGFTKVPPLEHIVPAPCREASPRYKRQFGVTIELRVGCLRGCCI